MRIRMKALLLAAVCAILAGCASGAAAPAKETEKVQESGPAQAGTEPEAAAEETAAEPAAEPEAATEESAAADDGVMTYAQYMRAPLGSQVVVETYVQGKHVLEDGRASIYTQDEDGGYFLYEAEMTPEVYDELVPGRKIRVSGEKSEYSMELEILHAQITPEEGEYFAPVEDVTDLIGTDELIYQQNCLVSFKGLTVEPAKEGSEEAYLYRWDGTGSEGDDLYFNASKDGVIIQFTIETDFTNSASDVYKAAKELKVGDVIDLEGVLYWYLEPSPHITKITKQP